MLGHTDLDTWTSHWVAHSMSFPGNDGERERGERQREGGRERKGEREREGERQGWRRREREMEEERGRGIDSVAEARPDDTCRGRNLSFAVTLSSIR